MNSDNHYIQPLSIPLTCRIEVPVYFLPLPAELKLKLLHLEELSNKRFIKEKHYLPLYSLKSNLLYFLENTADMKPVSGTTDDSRWIISCEKIDTVILTKLLKIWIKEFYIDQNILSKKRVQGPGTTVFAQNIIDSLTPELFTFPSKPQQIVLFDNGEVNDRDSYTILPLRLVSDMKGKSICIQGTTSTWMQSAENELITNPCTYTGYKGEGHYSYVISFSVQTLPPLCEPCLNIDVSTRRWITDIETEKTPYLKNDMSVYMKLNNNSLQHLRATYNHKICIDQNDELCCKAVFGDTILSHFEDIISHPKEHFTEQPFTGMYFTFKNGISLHGCGMKIFHKQNAGAPFGDINNVFDSASSFVKKYAQNTFIKADKVSGNKNANSFFDETFTIKEKLIPVFNAFVDTLETAGPLTFEIYTPQTIQEGKEIGTKIYAELHKHFIEQCRRTDVFLKELDSGEFTEALAAGNTNERRRAITERIEQIKKQLPQAHGTTIAIILLGGKDDFTQYSDPKIAIRYGFACADRMTQFITPESYRNGEESQKQAQENLSLGKKNVSKKALNDNLVIRNMILDTYRQIGINNSVFPKDKNIESKILYGVHVINHTKNWNEIDIPVFPVIVTYDMAKHTVTAETRLAIVNRDTYKREQNITIKVPYNQFAISFIKFMQSIPYGKSIAPADNFISDWFAALPQDRINEIFIKADGTSRKIIEGISNSEIKNNFDKSTGQIRNLVLSSSFNKQVDLAKINKINIVRIRTNDEVPDYLPEKPDDYVNTSGLFQYKDVYYSLEPRPMHECKNYSKDTTKIGSNKAFSHRNSIEIYPLYCSNTKDRQICAEDAHNLRSASIQFETGDTQLPLPLHLAKLLEEYME